MPAARGARALACAVLVCVGALALTPAGVQANAQAPTTATEQEATSTGTTAAVTTLTNWRSSTTWAYPLAAALAHARPSATAHAVGRLKFLTSDRQAELYLALASAQLPTGAHWIEVQLPGRPNGATGWVPAGALGPLHVLHSYLVIDRRSLRATLYREGHVVFRAPVGIGKPGTITPAGSFYVLEKLTTTASPAYGPFAIGTSAYAPTLSEWPGGGVVGIHGTNEPQLIPGRPSHGCVRMRNSDIARLWHLIALGTPVEIVH